MPTDYIKHKQLKENVAYLNADLKRKLNRFPYRFRLAKAFARIDADTAVSTRTLIGYEAGMKVFLAYTCYEQIVYVAVGLKILGINTKGFNQIANNDIAVRLHKNQNFMKMIKEVYENGLANDDSKDAKANTQLTNSLDNFIKDKSADVLCLAYAIRNMFAHGEFTGGGAGITNNSTKNLFYELANEVLDYSNKIYSQCITKLEKIR